MLLLLKAGLLPLKSTTAIHNGLYPRLSLAAAVAVCAWMLEGGTGRNGLIEPFRLDGSFGVAGLVRPQELRRSVR